MARKIGDVAIAITILLFCITAFSTIISDGDKVTGISSGIVASDLATFKNNLSSSTNNLESEVISKTDETASYIAEPDTQQETRNSESGGLINLLGKNIITKFITQVSEKLAIPKIITNFVLMIIGFIITILMIRFVWGESKV